MIDINEAIRDLSKGLDSLFTSDEERASYSYKIAELKFKILELQSSYKKEASKTKLFNWIGVMLMGAWIMDVYIREALMKFGINITDVDEKMIFAAIMSMVGVKLKLWK